MRLQDQHRVAVAVEAVSGLEGGTIGREDALAPGEGADQREQARSRQVEVREESVHGTEAAAGTDEEPLLPSLNPFHPRHITGSVRSGVRAGSCGKRCML